MVAPSLKFSEAPTGIRMPPPDLEEYTFDLAEFRDMKMQPSLKRALRHNDILKA